MEDKGKKYAFTKLETIYPKTKHCHYSDLPSPSAYIKDDIDYDGMGNQGRVPTIKTNSKISLIQKIKNKLWQVKDY